MEYPKEIYLDGYTYTQMYEHEKGGMYYLSFKRKSRSSYGYLYKSVSRWKTYIFMEWN